MGDNDHRQVLQIKKYPNRRYYDATRSCHVTLQEVHDLVLAGHDVCVTDSRSGEDITNLILFQVLLEKDQPKLDLFPASILHLMIRTNRQALRAPFERFFSPFMQMLATSQRQFDAYLRRAMGGNVVSPLDWANQMMSAFVPSTSKDHDESAEIDDPPPDAPSTAPETIEELRKQVAALTRQLEKLKPRNDPE